MRRGRLICFLALLLLAPGATAEFYRWTDTAGKRRVSNVPPAGVRADGSVREAWHPYGAAAQHARMRADLERHAAALEAAAQAAPARSPRDRLLLPSPLQWFQSTTPAQADNAAATP